MKSLILSVSMLFFLSQSDAKTISDKEKKILDLVSEKNHLTAEETILLYAVRSHEDGGPGLEFGINHPCAQYFNDGFFSLQFQADFCCWIIKEKYHGSILDFSRKYHHGEIASDLRWYKSVSGYYDRYRNQYLKRKVQNAS